MDKSKLLEEFLELKRLIKEHEKSPKNLKFLNDSRREGNNSTIFFNPKKIKTYNENNAKYSQKSLTSSSKVFINPNFRKPDSLSISKAPSKFLPKMQEKQPKGPSYTDMSKVSGHEHPNREFKKLSSQSSSSQHQEMASNLECGAPTIPVIEKNSLNLKNRVIFINPQFSSTSSKISTPVVDATPKTASKVNIPTYCELRSNSSVRKSEQKISVNVCRKRKIVTKESITESVDYKRRKEGSNNIRMVKKIFLNPDLIEKKENNKRNYKVSIDSPTKFNLEKNLNGLKPSTSTSQTLNCTTISAIPVLIGGREVSKKSTSETYPLCALGASSGKQVPKKLSNQRVRTCSSNLVTVTKTKLVRKRRLSHKITETNEKVLPKPLYVSKTKLVRNVSKKGMNSNCMAKIKIKQLIRKSPEQIVLAEKMQKMRRKSLTDKVPVKQRSSIVTKIKSNNGKSLKLVRRSVDSPSSSTEGMKATTQNSINLKKMELRQRASRVAMCLLQSRQKNNQFSKVNVPIKGSYSPSYNKNIYKKNNVVARKPLTKAALVGKKETVNFVGKSQVRNTPLDLTKFIKSKYRLIRKQSSNIKTRYRLGQKIINKITPHTRLAQRKKLKWRSKSTQPIKQRLTRKDLSIKKIGGVFYRCSRTTLARNKLSSKVVSQLEKKGNSQITSEIRNRFCTRKYSSKRQVSYSGGSFTTAPPGMSWRRSNLYSARSILTQAKQKSIELLSKKMKKNNEPCLFFHRYGRCSGQERGSCVRLHDRKYVAVCKKFIQGTCTDNKCSLSHSPSCHNMATCHHFLAGQCGRDNCPYPHIKVNDSAPICLDFLKGFCPLGDQCTKRHFEICPSFEKGTCARGKYCPYPHPKNKTGDNLKGKFKHIKRKPEPPSEANTVSTPSLRYFEDVNLQKENQIHLPDEEKENEVDVEEVTCPKRRPQLGELPSFIPLSQSFHENDT